MINIYKQKFTILQQEILRLLFVKTGMSLNARRIAQFLGVSAPAVAKAFPYLKKSQLIKVRQDKDSRRWSIEINTYNYNVMQLKKVDNLKQIYESGLADFFESVYPKLKKFILNKR